MRSLGAQDLCDLCDACQAQGSAARALAILARAEPTETHVHRELPVGLRDARLMALRERSFGARIDLVSRCPSCGTIVELAVTATDLGLDLARLEHAAGPQRRRLGGHDVLVRAVSAGDLADVEDLADLNAVRRFLLDRCVLSIDGVAQAPVPESLIDDVEALFGELDPTADIELELACPDCQAVWVVSFDAPDILWNDIRTQATRLLHNVAELARLYHWSERDILAMPAARRRFYLEAGG